ncbi:hypothetical protein COCVIDRAFT_103813 [Bipolaris victoriae FI3]|uniref:Uncharacterized protein n=1 Tax=Bipolaris victoriae (strain FI3) TaxID=930091 RepID=W7ELV0_BIPV3|nr:hypothetical protein COCVIDRAFT_103813 [Bipolaris victoriae FI3]
MSLSPSGRKSRRNWAASKYPQATRVVRITSGYYFKTRANRVWGPDIRLAPTTSDGHPIFSFLYQASPLLYPGVCVHMTSDYQDTRYTS